MYEIAVNFESENVPPIHYAVSGVGDASNVSQNGKNINPEDRLCYFNIIMRRPVFSFF
jgi:hypothetical protein